MKSRNGFVSNSSSSSYVIIGTKMKDKELKKLYNIEDENDFWDIVNEDPTFCMLWEESIFGIVLGRSDECSMEEHEYTLDEINVMNKKVKDFTGKTDIKIYTLEVST